MMLATVDLARPNCCPMVLYCDMTMYSQVNIHVAGGRQREQMEMCNPVSVKECVTDEIDKIQKDDPKKDEEETYLDLFSHKNMKLKERVLIPVKQYPKFNFVGKILGPQGNTIKRLQEETGAKISVLGKGSMRDKAKSSIDIATHLVRGCPLLIPKQGVITLHKVSLIRGPDPPTKIRATWAVRTVISSLKDFLVVHQAFSSVGSSSYPGSLFFRACRASILYVT
ncbi:UNVERIFIED_CONTAM: hypothetical protein K2H54_043388 [Gekko kuhli]